MTVLRAAAPGDLDGIMALECDVFAADAWSRATMTSELSGRFTTYLVAVDPHADTVVLGYVGVLASEASPDADIQTIAVAETERGRGLGRRLLRSAIEEAVERGARQVFLEVRADNPVARTLYDSEGFAQIGVRPAYYQPDGVDAVVMRLLVGDPTRSADAVPGDAAQGPL